MSTWFSSNLRTTAERRRSRWLSLAAAALLAAAPLGAQPLRQVLVEFRIDPGSTLDKARLTTPEVRATIEGKLAELAHQKFLYLEWLPAAGNADPRIPRWALRLADGPSGACKPPSVRALFRAGRGAVAAADFPDAARGDVEAWSYPEQELSALCDLAAPEMTIEQLVGRVSGLAALVLQDPDAMQALEDQFLSEIVVAKSLERDPAARKLYLPVKGLKAKAESEIEVRFENRHDNRLFAHPGDVEGNRTQLLLESFVCAGIVSSAPAANALPLPWHPRLPEVLDTCRDPWVYMKIYKPNPLETEGGVVRDFDAGGTP